MKRNNPDYQSREVRRRLLRSINDDDVGVLGAAESDPSVLETEADDSLLETAEMPLEPAESDSDSPNRHDSLTSSAPPCRAKLAFRPVQPFQESEVPPDPILPTDDFNAEIPTLLQPEASLTFDKAKNLVPDDTFEIPSDVVIKEGSADALLWVPYPIATDDDSEEPLDYNPDYCEDDDSGFVEDACTPNEACEETLGPEDKEVPIFEGSSVTLLEGLIAILSFCQSEKISGAGLARLLSLILLFLPKANNFFKSCRELFKMLQNREEPVELHYFCSVCLKARSSKSDICDTCTDETRTVHYFLTFSVESQLKKLYQRPNFLNDIQYKSRRVKQCDQNIEDIYDGRVYKKYEEECSPSSQDVTCTWNTDGLQIFNSTNFSMWPFYLVVNELPPDKRYLSENMIIAGIWGSTSKPHPNIFLRPIYKEMKPLLENGFDVKFFNDDNLHKTNIKLLCGTCDGPARSQFLNMKSHSGFFSCPVCYIKGENSAQTGGVTVFPYERNVELRTKEKYEEHCQYAVRNNVIQTTDLLNTKECSGIKGPTLLSYMMENPFESTAIDSMHCIYLGVMRALLNLWIDPKLQKKPFSIYKNMKTVNARLHRMSPPHFIQRAPQSLDKLVHWKASELRSFMFNISLCILDDVLDRTYFNHFLLFVQGVALLNTSSVSEEDRHRSYILLCKFVEGMQVLYGKRYMSHNLHMLIHLPWCVFLLGPLWILSCFEFEDMNGRLTKLIHGTRHAGLQVQFNLSVVTELPLMIHKLRNNEVKKFCYEIKYKWMQYKVSNKISEDVLCIGDYYALTDSSMWILDELIRKNVIVHRVENSVQLFYRLYLRKLLYVSSSYERGVRVSSFVKYVTNDSVEYGKIVTFARIDSEQSGVKYVAIIERLQCSVGYETEDVKVDHVLQYHPPCICVDIIDILSLQKIMYLSKLAKGNYLSEPLNMFELE